MLSTAELTAMRATIGRTLPDTCDVLRLTSVQDDAGGSIDTFASVATYPCRVRPTGQISPVEAEMAERLQGRMPYTVTLPHTADVRESDRIQRQGDAVALEVVGLNAPASWQLDVRALCARVA